MVSGRPSTPLTEEPADPAPVVGEERVSSRPRRAELGVIDRKAKYFREEVMLYLAKLKASSSAGV